MTIASEVSAETDSKPAGSPTIYDNVVAVLRERYYDAAFRGNELPLLAQQFRPAELLWDRASQREAAERLLAQIPASHLGLLSEEAHAYLIDELSGTKRPTVGVHLLRIGSDYFTCFVLDGGPASDVGIVQWERVILIDGKPVAASERLDWQQKDAFLSVDRDPPIHSILCRDSDEITLALERTPGELRTVQLRARPYSALDAARASARLLQIGGHDIGYVRFWFIHSSGVPELLTDLFAGEFANADALLIDLRGRGGNGFAVEDILRSLAEWGRPIVALTDRQSRSAKDVLAYEFKERRLARLVGEPTAGAVIPVSFTPVGEKTVLMFPAFTLGDYTRRLELKGGVEPHVMVERAGPYSAGCDPILERGKEEVVRLVNASSRSEPRPFAARTSAAAPAASEQRTDLPSIELIIAKMIDAVGGEKALRAHEYRTLRGTAELVGLPMKGEFVQKASAPDKSLIVMKLGDLLVRQGFDGGVAWSDTPMTGKQILTGAAANALKEQSRFYGVLELPGIAHELTPTQFVKWDGRYCIELKRTDGSRNVSFVYIDATSFLNAGTKAAIETAIGSVETKTFFRDHRSFDGFVTPAEIYVESSVQRQLIRIDTVSFEAIAPEEYAPPAGAK